MAAADIVFHLAGANRPADDDVSSRSNRGSCSWLCRRSSRASGRKPLVVFSSSIKAPKIPPYGTSKRAAEEVLLELAAGGEPRSRSGGFPTSSASGRGRITIRWSRPSATTAARGMPLRIDDPAAPLSLLYVDDLIDQWLRLIGDRAADERHCRTGRRAPDHRRRTSPNASSDSPSPRSSGEVEDVGDRVRARAVRDLRRRRCRSSRRAFRLHPEADPRGTLRRDC